MGIATPGLRFMIDVPRDRSMPLANAISYRPTHAEAAVWLRIESQT